MTPAYDTRPQYDAVYASYLLRYISALVACADIVEPVEWGC